MRRPDILVAVDIVEDQVVRLARGELQERTVYGHDPLDTARDWEQQGAGWLHVVDLDGATRGEQSNSNAVERILSEVAIPVQVGGGVRTLEGIQFWLDAGAARVVVGTKALDPSFIEEATREFGEGLVAAVDADQGEVKVAGWQEASGYPLIDTMLRLQGAGVARVMFTDIDRDGMLRGPNVEAIQELLDALDIPLIASGGVTTAHDVRMLSQLAPAGLEGIIIGKALYSGALTLEEATRAAES